MTEIGRVSISAAQRQFDRGSKYPLGVRRNRRNMTVTRGIVEIVKSGYYTRYAKAPGQVRRTTDRGDPRSPTNRPNQVGGLVMSRTRTAVVRARGITTNWYLGPGGVVDRWSDPLAGDFRRIAPSGDPVGLELDGQRGCEHDRD